MTNHFKQNSFLRELRRFSWPVQTWPRVWVCWVGPDIIIVVLFPRKVLNILHLCYEGFEGLNETDEELNDTGGVESNLEEAKFQNVSNSPMKVVDWPADWDGCWEQARCRGRSGWSPWSLSPSLPSPSSSTIKTYQLSSGYSKFRPQSSNCFFVWQSEVDLS